MKYLSIHFFLAGLLCLSIISNAQQLKVIIKDVRNNKGTVGAGLYNSDKDFMKKPFVTQDKSAVVGEVELVFDKLPAGTYGISVMHDANGNGKMDTNFIGIPKESFGFSNDAMGKLGPPSWDQAKFEFTGESKTITITLRHP